MRSPSKKKKPLNFLGIIFSKKSLLFIVLGGFDDKLVIKTFGSPTLSDQALLPFPSVKIGAGDSARSHTADEYVFLSEIENGINFFVKWLNNAEIE